MRVTDPRARRRLGLGLSERRELARESLQVEREGRHLELPVRAAPFVAGPVTVDLDAVAVRVREIERLADEVVRGAVQRPAGGREASERDGEIETGRDEHGEGEQAGVA